MFVYQYVYGFRKMCLGIALKGILLKSKRQMKGKILAYNLGALCLLYTIKQPDKLEFFKKKNCLKIHQIQLLKSLNKKKNQI